ncbi:MAG TPA: hypothetical protein VHE32_12495 [Rhodanobacteraceae bacterium]|nr:hypothetical protein [Rhodanobacteraceae bacterium]
MSLFVACAIFVCEAHADSSDFLVQSYLPANRAVSLKLCDSAASNYAQYAHFFHIGFLPLSWASGHSYNPAATPQAGGPVYGDTTNLAPGTSCQDVLIFTSGVQDSDSDVIDIGSCYDFAPTGGSRTCLSTIGFYTLLASITPSISLSLSSMGVGSTLPETVTLNPNFATLTIAASCTQQSGAVISVTPQAAGSNLTNDLGKAFFDIHTSIGVPVPGQTPSGTCTFSVPLATNGASASVQIQGQLFQPTLAISPVNIVQSGNTSVVATISPAYANVGISASCNASGASVTVAPSTQTTNASGHASFTVNAQNLVGIGSTPSASCTFHVVGGTGQAGLMFATGNACAFGLAPAPPACGNP